MSNVIDFKSAGQRLIGAVKETVSIAHGETISGRVYIAPRLPARWVARVIYRTENGGKPLDIEFEEFDDLGRMIEYGPHWDTIISIEIRLRRKANPEIDDLTVEKAQEL